MKKSMWTKASSRCHPAENKSKLANRPEVRRIDYRWIWISLECWSSFNWFKKLCLKCKVFLEAINLQSHITPTPFFLKQPCFLLLLLATYANGCGSYSITDKRFYFCAFSWVKAFKKKTVYKDSVYITIVGKELWGISRLLTGLSCQVSVVEPATSPLLCGACGGVELKLNSQAAKKKKKKSETFSVSVLQTIKTLSI